MPSDRSRDPLTGLLDRAAFFQRLRVAVAAGTPLAVAFLDLDRFQLINDSLGHSAGDELLVGVAGRLRAAVDAGAIVARLGGDEFTVLWIGGAAVAASAALVERVRRALLGSYLLAGRPRHVSASVGCRVWTPGEPAVDAEALLRDADAAMYAAKEGGRGRVAFFTDAIRARVLRRVGIEQRLRDALDEGDIPVHYQPVVDLRDGSLAGVEALLRWRPDDPEGVTPFEVVAVAEESSLIGELGTAVLARVCRDLAAWEADGLGPLPVSINVSGLQLLDEGFPELVGDALAAAGVAPSRVCLELTETAILEPGVGTSGVLERLRALGVFLAVDDFGTGYSSLGRLRDLPVEVLKIDRSFVSGLGEDPDATAIVTSVLSLAAAMGLHVVAEGVETAVQAAELRRLGCATVQGWLYAPAVPAAEIAPLCADRGGLADAAWRRGRGRERGRGGPSAPRARRSLVREMMQQIGIRVEGSS